MSTQQTPTAPDDNLCITTLRTDIAHALPGLTDEFDRRWAAAHAELSVVSNSPFTELSAACDHSRTFQKIRSMGPKIVPLIVEKLAKDIEITENLWAVFLYDVLESDEHYRPPPKEYQADLSQCRARIVELNIQRYKLLGDRLEALKITMLASRMMSNWAWVVSEDEYVQVFEMGKSAITPIMLAYFSMPDYSWHWLLHETAHGVLLKGHVFDPLVFLTRWEEFFNNGEENDLPAYAP